MRELCSHEVSFHSIPIAFCEGCTFIVCIDYLWLLRWWPQCLQYADFQTSWPVIGEKPEQPHPTVPLQWAPWTAMCVWRSTEELHVEPLLLVKEHKPTTATIATTAPVKNFFVLILKYTASCRAQLLIMSKNCYLFDRVSSFVFQFSS